jgi:mRNA interferase MazF
MVEAALSTSSQTPKRGEVWLVDLNPGIGSEQDKVRPAVVVSSDRTEVLEANVLVVGSDGVGVLPVKLVATITDWKDYFGRNIWHIPLDPTQQNGLTKKSAVDTLQMRSLDRKRFLRKLGALSADTMEEVAAAIAAVVEYQP